MNSDGVDYMLVLSLWLCLYYTHSLSRPTSISRRPALHSQTAFRTLKTCVIYIYAMCFGRFKWKWVSSTASQLAKGFPCRPFAYTHRGKQHANAAHVRAEIVNTPHAAILTGKKYDSFFFSWWPLAQLLAPNSRRLTFILYFSVH